MSQKDQKSTRRTSVHEREEVEESHNWYQPNIHLPPCPRFLLRCERGWCERIDRIGLALGEMLGACHRWYPLLRSHRNGGIEGEEGGRGEAQTTETFKNLLPTLRHSMPPASMRTRRPRTARNFRFPGIGISHREQQSIYSLRKSQGIGRPERTDSSFSMKPSSSLQWKNT